MKFKLVIINLAAALALTFGVVACEEGMEGFEDVTNSDPTGNTAADDIDEGVDETTEDNTAQNEDEQDDTDAENAGMIEQGDSDNAGEMQETTEMTPRGATHLLSGTGYQYYQLKNTSTNKWWLALHNALGDNELNFRNYNGSRNLDAMTLLNNGNVGIGTRTPNYKLDVFGNTRIRGLAGGSNASLYFNNNNTYIEYQKTPRELHFNVDGEFVMLLDTDSNSKNYMKVNGKIYAEEIEVITNVTADYVFEDSFNLMSLEEVDSFIKENKHLPGVASDADVAANGGKISIGDSYNQLLQKVEELTLHAIAQNKEIKALKNNSCKQQ